MELTDFLQPVVHRRGLVSQRDGERDGLLPGAGKQKPEKDNMRLYRSGYGDSMELLDVGDEFIAYFEHGLDAFDALVFARGGFEVQLRAETIPSVFGDA